MKRPFLLLIITTIFLAPCMAAAPQKSMQRVVDEALEFSLEQSLRMWHSIEEKPGLLPRTAKDGELVTCESGWWTSGFYPGTMWYLYEYSKEPAALKAAEATTERVSREQFTTSNHDVGFQINCSAGNGYRLTGREDYRTALVNAGNSLATRFDPAVGLTRSWNSRKWQYTVIIDNMMNLELLAVSSSLTGDNTHYDMARSHADKTMQNHFRPDGSSYHVVSYDSLAGNVLNRVTHQGVSDDSSWSRGQAWGLYGFVMMYRQTGDKKYLDHAVKVGKYIMNHPRMPKDKIPYWDFDAPGIPHVDRDVSAGAIMASAYVELSTMVEGALSEQFLHLAEKQIRSLASPAYRARKVGDNNNFILRHGTGFMAKQYEIDAPLAYADYYFVEALMRYRRLLEGRSVVDLRTAWSENSDRALWLSALDRVSRPLLENLSRGDLRRNMTVESITDIENRKEVTYLEALGRLVTGISPWLESGADNTPEGRLRGEYIDLVLRSVANAVDPASPDYMNFNRGRQPLVDAAFLAHGLLRARTQLWDRLDEITQQRLLDELCSSRVIVPSQTNWLFFSAMVECALKEFGGEWEFERVKLAIDRHSEWYKGDGWYGDGPDFHLDYYNSFVIQPMMMQVLETLGKSGMPGAEILDVQKLRYTRYAEQQERLISPEGTYPAVGRSLAYRFGAFHVLSDVSYRGMLPRTLDPAQVRCALTAVIRRQINAPGTFDGGGWLRVGMAGHQPSIGETYISTGSLYLCSAVFVALGLPESDDFWSRPHADWTNKKVWQGVDIAPDKAIKQ